MNKTTIITAIITTIIITTTIIMITIIMIIKTTNNTVIESVVNVVHTHCTTRTATTGPVSE